MISPAEYRALDAVAIQELITSGEVTASEIFHVAMDEIGRQNPALNAIVQTLHDLGDVQAKGLDERQSRDGKSERLLFGVPVAVKDCVAGVRGVSQKFGSRLTNSFEATRDEEIIRRYREAGAVFVAQTNVPEFSSSISTESVLYGPCRNPWDLTRTVGGSSGGSACAVASGMVPVATANDSAGSIRIPASCTGVFGFKPSRARTPNGPDVSEVWNGLFVQHVLTRSVRDSAVFLDVSHGLDAGAPYAAPDYSGSYLTETRARPARLRVAFSLDTINGVSVAPDCKRAVLKSAELLEGLGHIVIEAGPEVPASDFFKTLRNSICVSVARELRNFAAFQGTKISENTVERCHLRMIERGLELPATALLEFFELKGKCERAMGRFFQKHDVFLTPTLAEEPVRIGCINANGDDLDAYFDRSSSFSPFAVLANLCGTPSMSVPLHNSESGLPVGCMFTAAFGKDHLLLQLAAQLEEAAPWREVRPPLRLAADTSTA